MVPGQGFAVALGVSQGSGQNISDLFGALFVHIDGDHAVFAGNNGNHIFGHVHGPGDLKLLSAHGHGADNLIILGGDLSSILVDSLHISNSIGQAGNGLSDRFGGNSGGRLGFSGLSIAAAGKQSSAHSQAQDKRNQFSHG